MRKAVKQILCCALLVFGVFLAVAVAQEKPDARTDALNRADAAMKAQETPKIPGNQTEAINSTLLGRGAKDDNARKYRIGVGDEIIVEVFKHPEYSVVRRVNELGIVALPRIEKPIQRNRKLLQKIFAPAFCDCLRKGL
jgi:hypothetical protein